MKFPAALALASFALLSGPFIAGPVAARESMQTEESLCEKVWRIPVIYENKDRAFFQEFRFTGRLHVDVYNLNSNLGYDQDWVVRRLRFGFKAKLLQHLEVHVEAGFAPQKPDPLYDRLTDAYLAWTFCEAAKLTVGKHPVRFTLDGATSSNELLTLDRNNLSNNLWFTTVYISGVAWSGKIGPWQYHTGYYSGGEESPEFGDFNAGYFWLASIGYDFGKALGVKKALLRADYVYNDPNPNSDATRPFEQIGSLNFQLDGGEWGVSTDLAAGRGFGTQSNVFGTVIMPWLGLTERLQVVARYTYIHSAENNGIRFNRYENVITSGRGNEYHEVYLGLNYYVCGHRLKIQTGVDYAWMKDDANVGGQYDGWSWTTGLRMSF